MTIQQIRDQLKASVICGDHRLGEEVQSACGADLMSDVLMYVKHDTVLLTGLCNPQVIRTAEMLDVTAVVFVRGKLPDRDILDLAVENDMCILCTQDTLYTACGKLYKTGLPGTTKRNNT